MHMHFIGVYRHGDAMTSSIRAAVFTARFSIASCREDSALTSRLHCIELSSA